MIQFNLLPDVKLEFVRAQRIQRTVISASVIAAGSAFIIFLLLFVTVNLVQKKSISDLNGDIKKYNGQLKATPDLDKILTIQSQLSVLPGLHEEKASAARTFTYVQQLTPSNVSLSDVTTDYAANTMEITGQAASLDQVNTFIDTLKFTKFSTKTVSGEAAFSNVVMSQFSRTSAKASGAVINGATFTITLSYKADIFDNASNVSLQVPNTVSTRSVSEQPTDIFKKAVTPATTTTNGNTQ